MLTEDVEDEVVEATVDAGAVDVEDEDEVEDVETEAAPALNTFNLFPAPQVSVLLPGHTKLQSDSDVFTEPLCRLSPQ